MGTCRSELAGQDTAERTYKVSQVSLKDAKMSASPLNYGTVNKELASLLHNQLEDQTMERKFGDHCRH